MGRKSICPRLRTSTITILAQAAGAQCEVGH